MLLPAASCYSQHHPWATETETANSELIVQAFAYFMNYNILDGLIFNASLYPLVTNLNGGYGKISPMTSGVRRKIGTGTN